MRTKRVALLAGAAFIVAGNAVAADLRAPPPPLPVAPLWDWTGPYIGANVGYSFGRIRTTLLPASVFATPLSLNVNGIVGGAQAGYNFQVHPVVVLGVEGDIQGTGERGRYNQQFPPFRTTLPGGDFNLVTTNAVNGVASLPWFATLRARGGVLLAPQFLVYVTGGVAIGEVRFSAQQTGSTQVFGPGAFGTVPAGPPTFVFGPLLSASQTCVGWTVGGGVEYKFTRNWSVKAEYLYTDFGTSSYFNGVGVTPLRVSFRDHVARVGLNYAFGWAPAPVVARY